VGGTHWRAPTSQSKGAISSWHRAAVLRKALEVRKRHGPRPFAELPSIMRWWRVKGCVSAGAASNAWLAAVPVMSKSFAKQVARRVPDGVVCLLSALRFHRLTIQNPFEVWLAIDHKAWRPRIEHPPPRLVHLSGPSLAEGVEVHDVGGVPVRVFAAAKTVADCFKFRRKIGTDVAVEALKA